MVLVVVHLGLMHEVLLHNDCGVKRLLQIVRWENFCMLLSDLDILVHFLVEGGVIDGLRLFVNHHVLVALNFLASHLLLECLMVLLHQVAQFLSACESLCLVDWGLILFYFGTSLLGDH